MTAEKRSSAGAATDQRHAQLLRRGRLLEAATLAWNVVAVVVLALAALGARSVALVGFGLDSLVEIGASAVVLWELAGVGHQRQRRALSLIRIAFVALAGYLTVQSAAVLLLRFHPGHSPVGIGWTAVTALCMFALAAGKRVVGRELANPVLTHEASVTVVDGLLAVAVLVGLALNAALGWWWADPLAALVIVYYAVREARSIGHDLRAPASRPADGPSLR
jgi:Co/Zn/Cd efflux system component